MDRILAAAQAIATTRRAPFDPWAGHFSRAALLPYPMDDETFRTIIIIAGILMVAFFALAFFCILSCCLSPEAASVGGLFHSITRAARLPDGRSCERSAPAGVNFT